MGFTVVLSFVAPFTHDWRANQGSSSILLVIWVHEPDLVLLFSLEVNERDIKRDRSLSLSS